MGATDLPGDVARRDDMGVSHAADGSAALAPEGRARSERVFDIRLRDGRQTRLRRVGERLRAGLMPRALAWAG